MREEGGAPDPRAVERFRRILLFNIGLLAIVEVAVSLSAIWLGWSPFLIALLVFFAVSAAYLAYLVRRFATRGANSLLTRISSPTHAGRRYWPWK